MIHIAVQGAKTSVLKMRKKKQQNFTMQLNK